MAVPTTPISGVTMILKSGTNQVGAAENTTLNIEQDLPSIYSTSASRWDATLNGPVGWSIDFSNLYYEGAVMHGSTGAMTVKTFSLTGLRTMTINVELNLLESTSQTSSLDRAYVAGMRSVSVDFEAVYYDPNPNGGNDALDIILDEVEGTTTATISSVTVQFGTATLAGAVRVPSLTVSFPSDDVAQVSGTLVYTGAVTSSFAPAEAGQEDLLTNIFTETTGTAVEIIDENSTASQTQWDGATAFAESVQITVPYDDAIRISGTFRGTGALVRSNP